MLNMRKGCRWNVPCNDFAIGWCIVNSFIAWEKKYRFQRGLLWESGISHCQRTAKWRSIWWVMMIFFSVYSISWDSIRRYQNGISMWLAQRVRLVIFTLLDQRFGRKIHKLRDVSFFFSPFALHWFFLSYSVCTLPLQWFLYSGNRFSGISYDRARDGFLRSFRKYGQRRRFCEICCRTCT